MKKLLLGFLALVTFASAQTQNVIEASAAQAAAGTVGLPYVITPRRQGGGSGAPGTVTSVTVTPSSTVTGTVTNPTTTPAITLTAIGVTPPASGNQLVSGGGVDYVSGLQITVGAATYVIQGTQYTSPQTTLSAAAADPTNPRTDVVYVDSTGTVGILEGTPSNPAIKPQVDPATQLELTSYDLAAGATVLPVAVNDIYHENTEWATSKVGTPINLASTNNPYRGTVDIEGTAAVAGNSFTFTAPSTFDPGIYATLFFYVAPKASWPTPKQFSVQLLNSSGTVIGSTVVFKSGSFAFNSGATANVYQQVAIPVSLFGANGQTAKGLKFTLAGGGSSIGFYMDDFTLQAGLSPTTTSNAMVWKGPYSATTSYNINDVVTASPTNTPYVAIAPGTGNTPESSPTFWQVAGNIGTLTGLTGPITSVGNATAVASQTGTGSTFVMNTAPTISGSTLSGTTTQTGTTILTPNALAGTVINVAQRLNTKTVGADTTFTFSGTPSSDQWFGLELTNSDSSAHTITIPSSFLVNATPGGATTSVTLPASGKINLNWRYDGSVYNLYTGGGGSGTVTVSGSPAANDFALWTSATNLTKITPGSGVATWFQTPTLANLQSATAGVFGTNSKADTLQTAQLVTLTSSGTDTYAGTAGVTATAYTTGTLYTFVSNTANTGAASLNINSLGAKTIVKVAGGITTALADNDIRNGQVVIVQYDGTNFQLQSTLGNVPSGSGTVNSGTANQLAYYATTGSAVSGLTSANNGMLVTDGSGVPSISSTIPNVTVQAAAGTVNINSTTSTSDPNLFFQISGTSKSQIGVPATAGSYFAGTAVGDLVLYPRSTQSLWLSSNAGGFWWKVDGSTGFMSSSVSAGATFSSNVVIKKTVPFLYINSDTSNEPNIAFQINSVSKGQIGVAGSANAYLPGTAIGDMVIYPLSGQNVFLSTNGGSKSWKFDTNGNIIAGAGGNITVPGGVVGTSTNNSAASGIVGEYVFSAIASGSAVSLTTNTAANVTSISLTAGDWDVEGNVNFAATTATVTATSAGVTSTSATVPTDGTEAYSGLQVTAISETDSVTLPRKRLSLSGTTTVYLVGKCTFSAGTVAAFGHISARRAR